MEQSSSDYSERIWVIQQYLAGKLPDDLHQQVEERRRSDPEFDQQVLAQGVLAMYAEHEQNTLHFYDQTDKLTLELGKTRGPYDTSRQITYLPQLIKLTLAASLVAVFIWAGWYAFIPPAGGVAQSVDLESDESSGFGEKKVLVVRYNRLPGLAGLFQKDSQYRWPGDTLFLYGREVQKIAIDSLRLSTTDFTNQYQLQVAQQQFLIQKGQIENRPLEPNETP